MNWLTIITTTFNYLYLLTLLLLLWLIWRSSEKRAQHVQHMGMALVEVAKQDAESARQAVEATRILAAIVQNEQAK
ncbi:MAG: hypothetical protein ACRDHW_00680 [Ktedonobacteraceae bacterium]